MLKEYGDKLLIMNIFDIVYVSVEVVIGPVG